jgi:predicted RecB family nuclease
LNTIITAQLFDAYLKCATKLFLKSRGETGDRNAYAEWFRTREQVYLNKYIKRVTYEAAAHEYIIGITLAGSLKTAKWLFATSLKVCTQNLETSIQVLEKVPSARRSRSLQIIPIRFTFANKPTKKDRLLLAFDSFILSETVGRKISIGKIIHGDKYDILKVKTDTLHNEVRKLISQITLLLSTDSSPALALNQHCTECEFQANCMQKAIEKDDLSLLPSISEKERKKLNSKGISTITHLSYTFRPRRKSKRFSGNREKYQHSLKALAIRQRKIHVVGSDELRIEGTPVYLDVEGIPDCDFYYLIGIRVRIGHETIQHSLWAETQSDEKNIWNKFLEILSEINEPVIVHYGSFETTFLKQMCNRHGGPTQESTAIKALKNPINLLSFIYARIYFPTYSNGLKDIAKYLGFSWTDASASGIKTIIWRRDWEQSQEDLLKKKLMLYNAEDCEALDYITEFISRISIPKSESINNQATGVVNTNSLPHEGFFKFRKNQFCLAALEEINRTAYWDYQREKIILRSSKRLKRIAKVASKKTEAKSRVNEIIHWPAPQNCPQCGRIKLYKHREHSKDIIDVRFGRSSIKKWVTKYISYRYRCPACRAVFCNFDRAWSGTKYGPNLVTMSAYLNIDLRMSHRRIAAFINQVFGFNLSGNIINKFKAKAAMAYKDTYENILQKIVTGRLIHADETKVNLDGKVGYVWAFTSMENVVYIYTPSREGYLVQTMLKDFKGVLITDFYAAYESLNCPQQKCLIHLIRDLNDELLKEPFNEEIKVLTSDFANLLKSIIATVDRFGLKTRFLRKHKIDVGHFFRNLSHQEYQTELAVKYKKRFEKNRNRLFTFLDYDNVPWNNNNAEHAIKTIALLRRDLGAVSTERGIIDYLTLFSVRETCKFKGVNFFDFLRSGETDIDSYINSRISYKSLNK